MKYAAAHPHTYEVVEGDEITDHPARMWTFDNVLQVDDAQRWEAMPHGGIFEVPDSCTEWAPPVRPPAFDDFAHRGEWWREATMYVGAVGGTMIAHTPDGSDHNLVVDTWENWSSVDLYVAMHHLRRYLVPDDTPGMTVAQWNATRAVPAS
jgi:hypothetical protein